jgi:hypothetical protein
MLSMGGKSLNPMPRIEQLFLICLARIVVTAFAVDLYHINNVTEIKL